LGIQLNGVLFSTVELCLGIMIMCALSLLVNFQEVLFFFRTRLFKTYSFYFLTILLTSFFNSTLDSTSSIVSLVRVVEAYFFFIALGIILRKIEIEPLRFFYILKVAALLGSIYTIGQFFLIEDSTSSKIGGLLGGGYGAITSTGIIVFGYDFKQNKSIKKLVGFFICLFGTFCTNTRTWLLAPVLSTLIVYFIVNKADVFVVFKTSLFIILTIGSLFIAKNISLAADFPGVSRIYEVIDILFGLNTNNTSVDSRFLKWFLAYQNFLSSPLVGVGLENIDLGLPSWIDALGNKRSDSQFLDTLASNGIFALLSLCILFFACIKSGLRALTQRIELADLYLILVFNWMFVSFFWSTLGGFNACLFSIHIVIYQYFISKNFLRFKQGKS
tara:strand:- start:280 stop:1440 length:1161 start_codon:yes stop_codon:yes gene_type:complete